MGLNSWPSVRQYQVGIVVMLLGYERVVSFLFNDSVKLFIDRWVRPYLIIINESTIKEACPVVSM